ncbi:MAG: hypothetical protein ACREGJ_03510 [Candidatus Saccharimonadales bacterium]
MNPTDLQNTTPTPEAPQSPPPAPISPAPSAPAPLTSEVQEKHRQSVEKYPEISLSSSEYVIEEVRRHPIGLLSIWAFVGLLILIVFLALPFYSVNRAVIANALMTSVDVLPSPAILAIPALFLIGLFALGGFIATVVYNGNRFYLTNESVIQHVRNSLFHTKSQVIGLVNVEDASSTREGILEHFLDYGTLRLSTQGEETTYHFYYVADPKRVVNVVNDAREKAVLRLQGIPSTEH